MDDSLESDMAWPLLKRTCVADNIDYFYSQGQSFIATVVDDIPMIYSASTFNFPADCTKAKGNCPAFEVRRIISMAVSGVF